MTSSWNAMLQRVKILDIKTSQSCYSCVFHVISCAFRDDWGYWLASTTLILNSADVRGELATHGNEVQNKDGGVSKTERSGRAKLGVRSSNRRRSLSLKRADGSSGSAEKVKCLLTVGSIKILKICLKTYAKSGFIRNSKGPWN